MSRKRGDDDPPEPEIETIRNRSHIASAREGSRLPHIALLILISTIFNPLITLVAIWTTDTSLTLKIGVSALYALSPIVIVSFWLGYSLRQRRYDNKRAVDDRSFPYDQGESADS